MLAQVRGLVLFELKITSIFKSSGCALEKSDLPWKQSYL